MIVAHKANGASLLRCRRLVILSLRLLPRLLPRSLLAAWIALVGCSLVGCGGGKSDGTASGGANSKPKREVIVYTALDEVFSQPILDQFTKKTGIAVRIKADTESTKTVGLAQAIIAEHARPRCDLFWNNEILHTLRLQQLELLRPAQLAEAAHYPENYRSATGHWHGFAARARVLIVNTHQIPKSRRPKTLLALVDPLWRDRCGMAKPLAGTTATHAACLFAAWGDEEAKRFFRDVKGNAQILSGNRDVARRVASGALAFGLTDTDDAMVEIEAGSPVAIVYPDQKEGELGTLFIPNTLALIKGSAHPTEADELLAYLLRPEVEAQLAAGPSAQIPLHSNSPAKSRVETPQTIRAMQVDFAEAAKNWETTYQFLREEFAAAK